MKYKYIYLPLEVKVRETISKFLLANYLAKNGYRVIIGSQIEFRKRIFDLPRGIYFDKCASPNKLWYFKKLKEKGFAIVASDEEGGFIHDKLDDFFKIRISDDTLKTIDLFFAWGGYDFNYLQKNYETKEKIKLTGNPRIDLWSVYGIEYYKSEIEKIKSRYGNYIFVSSNFGANNISNDDWLVAQQKKYGGITTQKQETQYRKLLEQQRKKFNSFTEFLKELSNIVEDNIIIRPHPVEDPEFWKSKFKDSKRFKIIKEGDALPWLAASDFVIHNSCTTSIEATLLGKHVVSIQPNGYDSTENFPIEISYKISTVGEFQDFYKKFKNGNIATNFNNESIQNKITERLQINDLTIDRIAKQVSNLSLHSNEDILDKKNKLKSFSYDFENNIFDFFRALKVKIKYGIDRERYKFPHLKLNEAKEINQKINEILNTKSSVQKISKELYLIEKENV